VGVQKRRVWDCFVYRLNKAGNQTNQRKNEDKLLLEKRVKLQVRQKYQIIGSSEMKIERK